MPSPAAKGTCAPRAGIPMRCLPGDVQGAPAHAVTAGSSAPDCERVHHSVTGVNFFSYEDLGFAERFGGYQFVEAEATSVCGASPVNRARELKDEGGAPRATDVAQCLQLSQQRHMVAGSQVLAARIAMAHNVGSLTALSARTILEGPAANGN
jgi:acetyl-CoA C-acetyltransferase